MDQTTDTSRKKKKKFSFPWGTAFMIVGVVLVVVSLYIGRVGPFAVEEPEVFESPVITEKFQPQGEELPDDKLFITGERQLYESGTLRLIIPKLNIDTTVGGAVDEESLKTGPGLYDYAQLPGTGNRNVSIAGHRDIHGSIFYYIDTLTENDYLYLIYQGTIYGYTYKATTIVADDDWGPIYSQGFSCLTLTSCDPIGTSLNRIIVQSELSLRTPYTDNFQFEAAYQP